MAEASTVAAHIASLSADASLARASLRALATALLPPTGERAALLDEHAFDLLEPLLSLAASATPRPAAREAHALLAGLATVVGPREGVVMLLGVLSAGAPPRSQLLVVAMLAAVLPRVRRRRHEMLSSTLEALSARYLARGAWPAADWDAAAEEETAAAEEAAAAEAEATTAVEEAAAAAAGAGAEREKEAVGAAEREEVEAAVAGEALEAATRSDSGSGAALLALLARCAASVIPDGIPDGAGQSTSDERTADAAPTHAVLETFLEALVERAAREGLGEI